MYHTSTRSALFSFLSLGPRGLKLAHRPRPIWQIVPCENYLAWSKDHRARDCDKKASKGRGRGKGTRSVNSNISSVGTTNNSWITSFSASACWPTGALEVIAAAINGVDPVHIIGSFRPLALFVRPCARPSISAFRLPFRPSFRLVCPSIPPSCKRIRSPQTHKT